MLDELPYSVCFVPTVGPDLWPPEQLRAYYRRTENEYEYPIMIDGKLRAKQIYSLDLDNKEIERSVVEIENVKKWITKDKIKKIIIVPNKIINIVS